MKHDPSEELDIMIKKACEFAAKHNLHFTVTTDPYLHEEMKKIIANKKNNKITSDTVLTYPVAKRIIEKENK